MKISLYNIIYIIFSELLFIIVNNCYFIIKITFTDTSAYIDDAIFDEELCALSQNSQSGTRLT